MKRLFCGTLIAFGVGTLTFAVIAVIGLIQDTIAQRSTRPEG